MARKIGYVYLPLDVEFMDDDRVAEAGERAGWLYLAMCLRSKQLVSDGKLSPRQVERLGIKQVSARLSSLTRVGLVEKLTDGRYYITGWEKHNATAAELLDERQKAHEAAILGNHRRWHEAQGKTDPKCEHCTGTTPNPPTDSTLDRGGDRVRETGRIAKTETETETETRQEPLLAAPAAKTKRATSVPDTWPPDADTATRLTEWARENAPAVDLRFETAQWQDWHRAAGVTRKDWAASWRNWIGREQKRINTQSGVRHLRPVGRVAEGDAILLEAMHRGRAQQQPELGA